MNEVNEKIGLGFCSSCPAELGEVMVTLSLCDLKPAQLSSRFKWAVTGGVVLGQYCLDCGIEAAEDELERLGIAPKDKGLTEGSSLCGCCCKDVGADRKLSQFCR
ncbi:hypothetical protein D3C71_1328010 [compost metagenome]